MGCKGRYSEMGCAENPSPDSVGDVEARVLCCQDAGRERGDERLLWSTLGVARFFLCRAS